MLSNTGAYVKRCDGNDDLLEKHNIICDNVSTDKKKNLIVCLSTINNF